jgi:hypothetical protein
MRYLILAGMLLVVAPAGAHAQANNDFVVTLGGAWEAYSGNFSAVTLPVVDSTNRASAAIGEFRARGSRTFFLSDDRSLLIAFEGGLRQFAALGFQARDYAPREWVSQFSAGYTQSLSTLGDLTLTGTYRGRAVEDRPPMPLFLQPAYGSARGSARFRFVPIQGVRFDALADLERTNYEAPRLLSHLDLLDRTSQGIEIGALTGGDRDWNVRFFSGLRWSQYQRQGGSDDSGAFRRDRAINLGAQWVLSPMSGDLTASLGIEGTLNRSNSLRPEYDALSVTADLFTPLPWWDLKANASALLTWKEYAQDTPFARLVPGEEADNTSIVYLGLVRSLAVNLNSELRFTWARAETDIGNSYFNRFGSTLLFNFRPGG